MKSVTAYTSEGKHQIYYPESMSEVSVEQFQNLVDKWDGEDWIQGFSIMSNIKADSISQSSDGSLEGALYETISVILDKREWDKLTDLPVPEKLILQPIWQKDSPLIPDEITLPKKIGRLSIGQAIQARKSLEGVKDLREGLSIVTAIYLQPLIDKSDFDMLRVVEIEYIIKKMSITKIYPIGFFLLRKLNETGQMHTNVWAQIVRWIRMKVKRA